MIADATVYRDAHGQRLPVWLHDAFLVRERMLGQVDKIRAARAAMIGIEAEFGAQEIDWGVIDRHLGAIEQELMYGLPYEKCECYSGCDMCKGRMWLTLREVLENGKPVLRGR